MSKRPYITLTGLLFALLAVAHLARLILGWPANIGGWQVPLWLSAVVALVAGGLMVWAWQLNQEE